MDFISRIKRVVRRFSSGGTERDRVWMRKFCQKCGLDYKMKMQLLRVHLEEEESRR